VAALVGRHGVTHLQCTPSLAAMLVADRADAAALGRVGHLLVGGELLPAALAADLRGMLPGRLTNMYGPTETTIWSLVEEIESVPQGPVPIGRPIANTSVFVLDRHGQRLPCGAFGELHIGGEGVARGYHERRELTAERFVERPGMGRVYATGDLARIHPAGNVEFAGRADHQVKVRGHRIELGEVEAVLDGHPGVARSVVVARGSAADTKLVAFVVPRDGVQVPADEVRAHVAAVLPEVMVPSIVVALDALPLTPNGKVDRRALPAEIPTGSESPAGAPPVDDAERLVADIWTSELERPVGRDDNFFDIGGHSLLAVKVFRRLDEATPVSLSLTDVFRYPTVRSFAAHLHALSIDGAAPSVAREVSSGTDRGTLRRRALARRGGTEGGGA
jgi:acyl-coenzyme A synthetase/AMP-(fatty) acid ligase